MNDVEKTEACASVTTAFLQVMSILHEVEEMHCCTEKRNVLKILSQDTRHTKIVDLVCGTHKVSEELKKHSLEDSEGTQYTTNLDRNRYQTDNQYMVTVIRHNLSVLGLCPCLVDVEIIDQKSTNTKLISAGVQHCTCRRSNLGESKTWRKAEHCKMSCGARSCSPGSSSLTGDSPWGSPRTNPTSIQKHNLPTTKQKQRRSSLAHKRASFKRRGLIEEYKNGWKETPMKWEKDWQSFGSMDCYTNINDSLHRDYNKQNRDSGSAEGIDWENSNNFCGYATTTTTRRKFQNQNKTTSSGIETETKRPKSHPQQLDESLERLLLIVLDLKTRLQNTDPMQYSMEDHYLIGQLENEKDLMKIEVDRVIDMCRKGESKMDLQRSIIGQLFDSVRQEEEAKQKFRQVDDHSIRQSIEFQSNEENKHLFDPITQCFSNTSTSLVPSFPDISASSNNYQDKKPVFFKPPSNSDKK